MPRSPLYLSFFFFNDTATTEIYTLSLHDALPIFHELGAEELARERSQRVPHALLEHDRRTAEELHPATVLPAAAVGRRSEEHTSELQSRLHLVCRLLLEKKKHDNNDAKSFKPTLS